MEECGHATGEASIEAEASSQSRRASVWRCRSILWACWGSVRISQPHRGRSAENRPRADADCHA
jgi:hypothetical protein